jgi:hypothetical protein
LVVDPVGPQVQTEPPPTTALIALWSMVVVIPSTSNTVMTPVEDAVMVQVTVRLAALLLLLVVYSITALLDA